MLWHLRQVRAEVVRAEAVRAEAVRAEAIRSEARPTAQTDGMKPEAAPAGAAGEGGSRAREGIHLALIL